MDKNTISNEYRRLGYSKGWTFAMTPVANLTKSRAIIVGLNPGGGEDEEDYGEVWEVPLGNAYFDEKWIPESHQLMPLQTQITALHALLGLGKNDVFAGQFIPFRSRSRNTLANWNDARNFGCELWKWVFKQSPAQLVLCLGSDAASNIVSVLDAKPDGRFPSGWGKITVGRYVSSGRVVVGLPHLSRYQLFSMQGERLETAKRSILQACSPWPDATR